MYTWVKTYGDEIDTMELEELPEEPPYCGGGYWGRNSCEYLLFFVNPSKDNRPMNAPRERNVFYAPRSEHSAKPDIAYEVIRRNSPGPRVSLFQRSHREGFIPWGNQAPPDVPRADLVGPEGESDEHS
jgi:N6-adenosine-specific RNA methylase IME4